MVYNISATFLESYVNYFSNKKVSLAEMFKRLSLEMGGDGNTITKDQLDNYIKKAEGGSIEISHQKLSALKQMQRNWDTISKGDGSIDFGDMQEYKVLLILASIGSFELIKTADDNSDNADSVNSLIKALGLSNVHELKDVKDSDLNAHLKNLLADDSNDDSNANTIAMITNIIATSKTLPSIEAEA